MIRNNMFVHTTTENGVSIIMKKKDKKSMFFPGDRFRFCPVPGARNCVNLHLVIDIIHN